MSAHCHRNTVYASRTPPAALPTYYGLTVAVATTTTSPVRYQTLLSPKRTRPKTDVAWSAAYRGRSTWSGLLGATAAKPGCLPHPRPRPIPQIRPPQLPSWPPPPNLTQPWPPPHARPPPTRQNFSRIPGGPRSAGTSSSGWRRALDRRRTEKTTTTTTKKAPNIIIDSFRLHRDASPKGIAAAATTMLSAHQGTLASTRRSTGWLPTSDKRPSTILCLRSTSAQPSVPPG